jgi:cell division protein FtsQ
MAQPVLSLPRRRTPAIVRLLPSGRSLLIGLAVVATAAGLYGLARETSMFAVRAIRVQGASPEIAMEVKQALRSFEGTNLLVLNGAAVLQDVESLPAVESASYDRGFPHTLRVRVVPEQPVAVLRKGLSSWLISKRGRVIRSVDPTRFRSLPRIWVSTPAAITVGSVRTDDLGATARAVATVDASRFGFRVSWARVVDGTLTLGLRDGVLVRFGPLWRLPLKLAIAKSILPTLGASSAGGTTYLDVSVPERPVSGTNPQAKG